MNQVIGRLKEPSSWAAIALALGVFGIPLAEDMLKTMAQVGTGIAALTALVLKEGG